jgi:hypothetical protein
MSGWTGAAQGHHSNDKGECLSRTVLLPCPFRYLDSFHRSNRADARLPDPGSHLLEESRNRGIAPRPGASRGSMSSTGCSRACGRAASLGPGGQLIEVLTGGVPVSKCGGVGGAYALAQGGSNRERYRAGATRWTRRGPRSPMNGNPRGMGGGSRRGGGGGVDERE